jgi:hypothetical protein
LHLSKEAVSKRLSEANQKLLQQREKRIRPGLDDKVLTSWNGLMLSAFCAAARILDSEEEKRIAQRLGEFLLDGLNKNGKLMRSWRKGKSKFTAYLEDHAALGLGLMDLYQVDFDSRWYKAAVEQAQEIIGHFTDSNGGFFDTRDDHEKLIARPKSIHDSPIPSGNTLAISLLQRLGAMTGDPTYIDPALRAIQAMQENAARYPNAFAGWLCEFDFALGPQLQLALLGDPNSKAFSEIKAVIDEPYLPNLVIAAGVPYSSPQPELILNRELIDGKPTAYLCQGFTCKIPTNSADTLRSQLKVALDPKAKTQ